MIVGKDYWLSEKDIDTCIKSGAISSNEFNLKDVKNSLEDVLVSSNVAVSKGFLRKNQNSIKLFVFRGESVGDIMCFKKETYNFGKFDNSNVEKILIVLGSKFTLISNKK